MKKAVICAFLLGCANVAADCKIEDIKWSYNERQKWLVIEGTTTCEEAHFRFRAYNADGSFLGNASTVSRGFTFATMVRNVESKPRDVQIKWNWDASYKPRKK